jgi:hypothetical protein
VSETFRCHRCGTVVMPSDLAGLCPACLLGSALADPAAAGDDVDEEASLPPQAVYRVLNILAGGSSRTTYLAEDQLAGRLVTLDVVKLAPAADDAARAAVMRRIDDLRRLQHPAIPATYDGRCTPAGEAWVAAAHVGGRRIDRFCEAAGLEPALRAPLFQRACEAVVYAHRRGVCHGRLRVDSVLVRAARGRLDVAVTGYSLTPGVVPTPADDVDGLLRVARAIGWDGAWPSGDGSVEALAQAVSSRLAEPGQKR